MGCASSSPLVGAVPGGLVENVKATASDVMQSGENAMNGEYLTLLNILTFSFDLPSEN